MVDEMVQHVLGVLADYYHELDDSGESPFGEYALVEREDNTIRIGNPETLESVLVVIDP